MPKNLKGGNKHKKMKNNKDNNEDVLILKDSEDQDYAKVQKLLGNCRVELICNDKEKRLGIIRGQMRKKVWVNINSVVLYSKREYEDDKVDIIHVYKNETLLNHYKKMNLTFSILNEEEKDDDIYFNDDSEDDFNLDEI